MSMTKLLLIHLTFVAEQAASLEKTFSVFVSPARGGNKPHLALLFHSSSVLHLPGGTFAHGMIMMLKF